MGRAPKSSRKLFMSLTHSEIRGKFKKFMESKGHKWVASSSLLPENDPTTLFTGSGMQPMMPYLLGQPHPQGKRIADAQRSFRAEDIEEVGDNRHTTFFEMLGNWSFGDYWKEEQISWMFEFLTKEIGIDPNRLYVTVFAGDKENNIPRDTDSPAIWKKLFTEKGVEAKEVDLITLENASEVGMQGGRIFYYDSKKNWWSRAGKPGQMPAGEPGGPDSEMFYQFDVPHDPAYGKECHPNCDCGRFIEIGNNVFMEYKKLPDGSFELLKQRNVDFGGGFERIVAAAQDKSNIFSTDLIAPLMDTVRGHAPNALSGEKSYQIVADHLRAAYFLAADGLVPGNKDKYYILRRLIRRATLHAGIVLTGNFLISFSESLISTYKGIYPDLELNKEQIELIISDESNKFGKKMKEGREVYYKFGKNLSGQDAFLLWSSFGFPIELTQELARQDGKMVDIESFKEEYLKHQEISRAGAEKKFGGHGMTGGEMDPKKTRLHTATHIVVAALEKVLGEKLMQAGSDINEERLRFDFKFGRKVTPEELKQAEDIANKAVADDLPVTWEEMNTDDAFSAGASGAFRHKYGDKVKVYTIGDKANPFSKEICGGPHVTHTGEVGHITITKEESVSGGNRRIRAVVE